MAPLILRESAAMPAIPPSPCSFSCLKEVEGTVPWTQFAPQQAAEASGWELCLIILDPGSAVTTGADVTGQELHDTWRKFVRVVVSFQVPDKSRDSDSLSSLVRIEVSYILILLLLVPITFCFFKLMVINQITEETINLKIFKISARIKFKINQHKYKNYINYNKIRRLTNFLANLQFFLK